MNPFTFVDYLIWASVGCFFGAIVIALYLLVDFIRKDK